MDQPEGLPVAYPHVVYGSLSDGAVLFSTKDEVYFGLNEIGAQVWELLPPASKTLSELCGQLGKHYDGVDPKTLRADVTELLAKLHANGLVHYPEAEQHHGKSNTQADADRQADTPSAE